MEFLTSNGKVVKVEDCGDTLEISIYNEKGVQENSVHLDGDSLEDMLFN